VIGRAMNFKFTKPYTGLDIDSSSLRMVQIVKEKRGWRLIRRHTVQFPSETIECSYKDENIVTPHAFTAALEEALSAMSGRVEFLGLSLPIESLKLTTYKFEGLHEKKNKITELIAWKEKETLPYPVEKAKISFYSFNQESMAERVYLTAIGYIDIIKDFELNIKQLKLNPKIIRPAVINQINFYMQNFDTTGIMAYLGLFKQHFSFFVFHDDRLIFYRGKRKPVSYIHFIQEIDMTIELFQREYPGKNIERLVLGRQLASIYNLDAEFENYTEMEISMIDENSIITMDEALLTNDDDLEIGPYASAIGAAQSLAD
jgi:Tfp pilus assembly PilM family ATPase